MWGRAGLRLQWILFGLLSVFLVRGGGYKLVAPRNYTVFTGDIRVSYSMGNMSFPNSMVQLLTLPGDNPISTVGIPEDYLEGELTFACSVIDYAGEFRFRLIQYYGGPTLVETPIMFVSWPLIRLTLPSQHVALSKEVTMQFTIASKLCDTAHSSSRFWLDVVYYGKNDSGGGSGHGGGGGAHVDDPNRQRAVVHKQELRDFTSLQDVVLTFPCNLFDQAGIYQVTFASSGRPDRLMSISNRMRVEWSRKYSLSARVESVFPCDGFIRIYYTQPDCSGQDDKIRMYKQLQIAESSAASPTNLYYVGEQRARKGMTFVTFTCNKFDENVPGYCFKYATIANNGAVHEQTTMCLLSSADQGSVVHGGWSMWSPWTSCAGGLECGEGKRTRYRACDNPPAAQGGRFCDGDTVQWQDCSITCKDSVTADPPEVYTPDPACVCGCVLSAPRGKIIGTTDRCRGSSTWLVRAPRSYVIQLEFELFALDPNNRMTWVKVRDGESHMNNLLVQQFGGQRPSKVRSSGNVLLVELMSPYDPNFYSNKETFVAVYKRVVANGTGVTGDGERTSQTSWESTVTIVGVGLCFVIILATIAFACHYRISKRHQKTKKQQALLTPNGSMPNSPSHSHSLPSPTHGSGGGRGAHSPTSGSNNVTFASDVHDHGASKSGRRQYVLPQTVPAAAADHTLRSPTGRGRELAFNVDSGVGSTGRPGSASSHAAQGVYVSPVQCGYGGDMVHDPKTLNRLSAAGAPDDTRRPHRHHRRSTGGGPASPPGGEPAYCRPASLRSRSPESQTGSGRESRNQSFKRAVDKSPASIGRDGVPLADEEDLSPVSPTSPTTASSPFYSPARGAPPTEQRQHRGHKYDPHRARPHHHQHHHPPESIPMDSYNNKRFRDSGIEDTPMGLRSPDSDERREVSPPEARPPVEGRDAGRRVSERGSSYDAPPYHAPPPPPDHRGHKPDVKALPLRNVERPDGQSPENHHTDDANSHTPSSADGLSPVLHKNKLFPENGSHTPSVLSLATQDGYEYDDYIPDLPGSYFTMDPHAYTLTWSNQQPWHAQKQRANSENSVSTQNNESHA